MEERFYKDIGRTLKKFALIEGAIGLVGIAVGCVAIIGAITNPDNLPVVIGGIGGGISTFIASFLSYGIAQVIDDIHFLRISREKQMQQNDTKKKETESRPKLDITITDTETIVEKCLQNETPKEVVRPLSEQEYRRAQRAMDEDIERFNNKMKNL